MAHLKKDEIAKRLARIKGQVKGIEKMVGEDKTHSEIVQQLSAVRASLDSVMEIVVEDLIEHYISKTNNQDGKDIAIEIRETVQRLF